MSQISPPLRILLIGSVLFLAAWMLVLRPHGSAAPAPAPATPTPAPAASRPSSSGTTAHTSLGRDVQKARDAAQTAGTAGAAAAGESAPASHASTAQPTTTGHHTTAPAKPAHHHAVAAKGLPLPVAKAIAARKVLVLYFWNPKALDDQAVRHELHHVDRHGGKVAIQVANVRNIARYAPIAKGVDVEQSPATVVIDRKLQATLLTGYVDHVAIDQAVSDALHAR